MSESRGFLARIWRPNPKPPGFANGATIPQYNSSWPSRLLFSWLAPLLSVGFSRPLEKEDLWLLDEQRKVVYTTDLLERNFYARCPPENRPLFLQENPLTPATEKDDVAEKDIETASEKAKTSKKLYDASLIKALEKTFRSEFWQAGFLKLAGDSLSTTSPLVTKRLLQFLLESYLSHRFPAQYPNAPPIGQGIGLAFGLFAMQVVASLCHNHALAKAMTLGLQIRSTVIAQVNRKALRLSGRSRVEHSAGKITTIMSTDTTRLDFATGFVHSLWVTPIMILLSIALLINNLGYSALVAAAVIVFGIPVQGLIVTFMFKARKAGIKITDSRVRLLKEIVQGIRLIKIYAWESLYGHKIDDLRRRELVTVRNTALWRSALIALVGFIPVAAGILSFVTYNLTGHILSAPVIFSSLQLINMLRMPLIILPMIISLSSDAAVSLGRVAKYLLAEELPPPYPIDREAKLAVDVDADFTWEVSPEILGSTSAPKSKEDKKEEGKKKKNKNDTSRSAEPSAQPSPSATITSEPSEIFTLKNLHLNIARGQFVALVGKIGSGKSSCLNALVGEMRKTRGEVSFGGTIAYCPQTAWLANATLQDNILFGSAMDEARYEAVIKACSLEPDLEMLPNGDQTEIGERGINLSGGQKARVSLARAAYSETDIVLLDDPLSAVDAHVGKSILEHCLVQGPLANRTRILATHALSALPSVDYIYVFDKGAIVEQGTYEDLLASGPLFSRLIADYGGTSVEEDAQADAKAVNEKDPSHGADVKPLMQDEDRNTGQIGLEVYKIYLKAAGGYLLALLVVFFLMAAGAADVSSTLILGWWTSRTIPGFNDGKYMALYAGVGGSAAVFSFISAFTFSVACVRAGRVLFRGSVAALLRSPVSFFDTTPVGRILSRLSRDVESLDNQLPNALFQLTRMLITISAAISLIFYSFPYLGIALPFIFFLYYIASSFYRRTSVETKRLDSVLRSNLYASLSETLSGLVTVRAWRAQDRYLKITHENIDAQNQAYLMSVLVQRWLGIRLDFLANIMVLGIGLFAVGLRNTSDPSKTGVVLSYGLAITQTLSDMVAQMARSEQEMNAVERLDHYRDLESEAPTHTPDDPDESWPSKGEISFDKVQLAYRPGLPFVLHAVTFKINPGEKVGVVGRTGAGKSSLLQALFRIVEISDGKIEIDGVDTKKVGLDVLRHRLAVIPQDPLLFEGTVRENIDPLSLRTDVELLSALRRAWLLPQTDTPETPEQKPVQENGQKEASLTTRFDLNAPVTEEGANFSAGERQLVALCRALVKDSRIIVMDEATSNVDVETDAKIQRTIQTEFASSTLLCIAHRLNTIVYYDRILVLDHGNVAEFDTPLALYDTPGSIFRSLCREASLTRDDIIRIRSAVHKVVKGED